ncbi:N-acetylmuramoyl-L-alanine amidase [Stackebrandtia endophytica]|uniref:N-acetylmuramoyl-L-alanine amidase n=1 Tax=Stackebrandtia endophytica TaxID=1496996 RepID=A0A543AX46_9ACTN|nr:N-acetylmuramoyl-L-alanine amidase [Stackebrandtia endophytica]TQL77151.1 N-acetylmuramoyl-L-alanine amidase [Stackebrandtia endophytica]
MRSVRRRWRGGRATAALVTVAMATGMAVSGTAAADPPADRQAEFSVAAQKYGVPESVLLAVSYMQSRWKDHDGEYSTTGGFGPMHLTDVAFATSGQGHHHDGEDARGDDRRPLEATAPTPQVPLDDAALQTVDTAASLTGHSEERLRSDSAANIEGGAALLADYQADFGGVTEDPAQWYGAVAKYSGASDTASASTFADDVFDLINSGAVAETDDGTVTLSATMVDPAIEQLSLAGLRPSADEPTDCPTELGCEWIPAPYEQYGEGSGDYGNHDKANRPEDIDIDYIVIHDTEGSYDTTLRLVQDPTYVSWQYTLRSADGHVAQHVRPADVAWQAGNWSVNMRSIGLEHEGYAADGSWYTESLYRSSAKLVRYLADRFDVPLDRAHIIGHDNVPGTTPANVPGMHWDPGPYWDWSHYFDLLGAPLERDRLISSLVMINPDFETNQPEMIGCDTSAPAEPCPARPSSTMFLYSEPNLDSDLLLDIGLHPGAGGESTNRVSDLGSRAATGQVYAVADLRLNWTAVWYLGQKGWIYNPWWAPTLSPVSGQWIQPKTDDVPIYGVAYPEDAAYDGTEVPVQQIQPLPYTIDKNERYSFGMALNSQYYWAKDFQVPGTVVNGDRVYYQIQLGNRIAYVDADDVKLRGRA